MLGGGWARGSALVGSFTTPRMMRFGGSEAAEDGGEDLPSPRTNSGTTSPAVAKGKRTGEQSKLLLQEPRVPQEGGCAATEERAKTEKLAQEWNGEQERAATEARAKLMLGLLHDPTDTQPSQQSAAPSDAGAPELHVSSPSASAPAGAPGNRPKSRRQR